MEKEGGPGEVEIVERGRVLWARGDVQLVVAMPLVACPTGAGATWSGASRAPLWLGLAWLGSVEWGTCMGHGGASQR